VNAEFVAKLAALDDQLRSATEDGAWKVDLSGFNEQGGRAEQARQEGKHEEALKYYMHAISYMMAQLREQSRRRGEPPL
jgi:hypothetical protein